MKKIAIGIISYNESANIQFVLKQVDKGIQQYFNPQDAIIINVDNFSTDNTKNIFLRTPTVTQKLSLLVSKGKGRSILKFFEYCHNNEIAYVVTLDADLKSIEPIWVYKIINSLEKGFDLVLPLYTRNRFEANITNHFAYPMIFALYGVELRQPLGGEFGLSIKFCEYLLKQKRHNKTYFYGIDVFITLNAVRKGFLIDQVYLGKKIHSPSFYHMELTFRQVFESALFAIINSPRGYNRYRKKTYIYNSGIDDYKYFPHKKIIPALQRQIKKRFLRYEAFGYYNKFIKNKIIYKKLSKTFYGEALLDISADLWTDYLLEIINNVIKVKRSNNLHLLSRITIPIYRQRAITYWLESENLSSKSAESLLIDQALLLKEKVDNVKRYEAPRG